MLANTRVSFFVFSVCGLLFAGCGKSEQAAQDSAPTPAANEAGPAASAASQPTASASSRKAAAKPSVANPELVGTVHPFMTEQLHVFILQKGRMPQSFGEFANARMDSVPRPPPGLMWAIDNNTKEVKLVRQQ